jgi:hypothetical protein
MTRGWMYGLPSRRFLVVPLVPVHRLEQIPGSKKKEFDKKRKFFSRTSCSLLDIVTATLKEHTEINN